jgi:hypothetical protein
VRRISSGTGGKMPRLQEVGRLDPPKQQGKYEAGQFFLDRVFAYCNVIPFPRVARLFEETWRVNITRDQVMVMTSKLYDAI